MSISIPTALRGGGNLPSAASAGPGSGAVATQNPGAAVAAALQAAATTQQQQSSQQVQQAYEKIKAAVAPMAQNLQFSMDESSGKTVVRVVDSSTQEVIRQIPSEEVLKMAQELDRMQGLLLRGKA
ncbi:MAG: flagellar protein FlaG [Sterolibacterium sp.]